MAAAASENGKSFKSLKHFRRETGKTHEPIGPGTRIYRDWTAPIAADAEKARREALRLAAEEELTARQEREAEAKLGKRLIDIGYRVLSKELHPDKVGGSREAMARLNRVKERLRANV